MKVLNGAFLTSCAHLSRIVMGLVLLKVIAYYLGAEGMGQLGQFMSLSTMVYMVAGGGVTNAVIKYVAEYASKPKQLLRFVSAVTTYSAFFCGALFVVGVVFAKEIALMVFNNPDMYGLVIVLACAQGVFAFVNLVVGISNGLMQTEVYSKIQIVGSLLGLPVIWLLIMSYGLVGAALSVIVMYAATCLPAVYYYRQSAFHGRVKLLKLNKLEVKRLSAFTVMMLTSAMTFPVVEMVIRHELIDAAGYTAAGVWQGAIKLSSAYLGFFTVFLAYYFMPIVSRLEHKNEIGRVTLKFLASMALLYVVGANVFYWSRSFLIPLILSDSFNVLSDVIIFQLVGDFFRILSYVVGFVAVAKAATRLYILAEFVQNGLFLISSILILKMFGDIEAVMIAYMASYIIYFCISIVFFSLYLKATPSCRRGHASNC